MPLQSAQESKYYSGIYNIRSGSVEPGRVEPAIVYYTAIVMSGLFGWYG